MRQTVSFDAAYEEERSCSTSSGRALAFPVLKGTLERHDDVRPPTGSHLFRDRQIQQVQDLMRSIDYLETRDDVDQERIAYYGWSWGGAMAPLALSLEPRFQAAVLHVAGLYDSRPLPEVDPLGTPPEDKRFHVAESGHFVPHPVLIRESLDWLDRYLAPVEGR